MKGPLPQIQRSSSSAFGVPVNELVQYKLTTQTTATYALLVITPQRFARALQPLVDHKNDHGVPTTLVTLRQIYADMSQGRDEAEKVKYFIKQAIEEWGIQYVLLVGGMKHQRIFSWYLPVRYIETEDDWEPHYISDLYYADIYDSEGNFSSWDSDGDGIFGEWYLDHGAEDSDIDLYPDVAVGRLPCRNLFEVRTMVNKIITYETSVSGEPWFNDMICVAGDTYPELHNPNWTGYEGEEYADMALDYMTDFNPIRLYTSDGSFAGSDDVISTVSRGCGFLYFVGHGNPMSWGNHPPDSDEFITGLTVRSIPELDNGNMLPVCVVSGCHNSQFDVSLLRLLSRQSLYLGEATRECWSWRMTNIRGGGSIATIGCTSLGYTKEDKVSFAGGLNELEVAFFEAYGQDNHTILGDAWAAAVTTYLDTYTPIDWTSSPLSDSFIDVKVVTPWALFGDPSLQLGGY